MGKCSPRLVVIVARLIVSDNSDDFKVCAMRCLNVGTVEHLKSDLVTDGVFVRKVSERERFVYNRHVSRSEYIVFREKPAAKQWQPEGLEVAFAALVQCGIPALLVRFARNDRIACLVCQWRQVIEFCHRNHAWSSLHLAEELASQRVFLF